MEHDEAIQMLKSIAAAFDGHDLDAILVHFADDAVFESPRGPEAWGQRFVGKERIRDAFAGRFSGIPDIRYQDDEHFVDGDRAPPNGPSLAPPLQGNESKSEAATSGASEMARSSRRTRSGRCGRPIS